VLGSFGDETFWMGNRVGGALYVLKGNSYVRVSIGGPADQASKIKGSKAPGPESHSATVTRQANPLETTDRKTSESVSGLKQLCCEPS
jgi:hypothetical protein